jgi:COP9 signalosome complex subunit 2
MLCLTLLLCVMLQALLGIASRYQRVALSHLAKELSLEVADVEKLLVDMMLDGKLAGAVDQLKGVLTVREEQPGGRAKEDLLYQYATMEETISQKFHSRS